MRPGGALREAGRRGGEPRVRRCRGGEPRVRRWGVEPGSRGDSLLDAIGGTPLLELRAIGEDRTGARLFGKAEFLNPGGSVKDRAARAILSDALAAGTLSPGKAILDATSGNTGIALAMIGASLGYPVTLCLPANASEERKRILAVLGASLVLTDPLEGTDGAILRARELASKNPRAYFYADQYSNEATWRAHFETTGPEILRQTAGRLTHFVAGVGTSGTFVGVSRALVSAGSKAIRVAIEPDGPLHGLEGMKHLASAMVPAIWDPSLADGRMEIETEEAYAMCRRLAREEGLLVGPSSGANVAAALRVARASPEERPVVVTILCDGGSRYLSHDFWRRT
jgi:S-sulfo-L-cysteine synthase (O-acetyl-L-serine-dependent)